MTHLDLSLHSNAKECDEIHNKDRPEDGDVEKLEEGAEEGNSCGLGGRVPEFELR